MTISMEDYYFSSDSREDKTALEDYYISNTGKIKSSDNQYGELIVKITSDNGQSI